MRQAVSQSEQISPDAGAAGVAKPVQACAAGLDLSASQGHLLLQSINDATTTRVDAEEVKGAGEVWHVGLQPGLWH